MRYIGLDLGNRTCGLAISDSLGMIATSLYTVRFFEKDLNACLTEVVKVINEKKAEKITKTIIAIVRGRWSIMVVEYPPKYKKLFRL